MSLADGILDHAVWVSNPFSSGISYAPGPATRWKLVMHEIQGSANRGMIAGHRSPPQLWYDPAKRELIQTIPLTRAGFALYHYSGRAETNRSLAIQCEIAGMSSPVPDEPQAWLDAITYDVIVPCCQFVAAHGGSIDLTQVTWPFSYPGSASEYAAQRLTDGQFDSFNGIGAHWSTPQNEHWDTGAMRLDMIAAHARLVIGGELAKVKAGTVESMFRLRPVPFDDPGTYGTQDQAWDHYWLPPGATIIVANRNPDFGQFTSVLYGPGFNRNDVGAVVRAVSFGAPVSYVTRAAGQHTVVVQYNAPVDVSAVY